MYNDPIMQELREIRKNLAKECNYDIQKLCEYFKALEEKAKQEGRKFAVPKNFVENNLRIGKEYEEKKLKENLSNEKQ